MARKKVVLGILAAMLVFGLVIGCTTEKEVQGPERVSPPTDQ